MEGIEKFEVKANYDGVDVQVAVWIGPTQISFWLPFGHVVIFPGSHLVTRLAKKYKASRKFIRAHPDRFPGHPALTAGQRNG